MRPVGGAPPSIDGTPAGGVTREPDERRRPELALLRRPAFLAPRPGPALPAFDDFFAGFLAFFVAPPRFAAAFFAGLFAALRFAGFFAVFAAGFFAVLVFLAAGLFAVFFAAIRFPPLRVIT